MSFTNVGPISKGFSEVCIFLKFKALWLENDTVEGLGINICKSTPTAKASLNPHPPPKKKEKEKVLLISECLIFMNQVQCKILYSVSFQFFDQ